MYDPPAPPAPPAPAPHHLTADEFLEAADLEVVAVEVPEWKGTVHLRVLPADVGLALGAQMDALPKDRQSDAMFMLLRATLCTPAGVPLISNDEQAAKLRTRSTKVLIRLQRRALDLQGWSDKAEGAAKNV